MNDPLIEIARLLSERNSIDAKLGQIIDRPTTSGHLGEWIASEVFDIKAGRKPILASADVHFEREMWPIGSPTDDEFGPRCRQATHQLHDGLSEVKPAMRAQGSHNRPHSSIETSLEGDAAGRQGAGEIPSYM